MQRGKWYHPEQKGDLSRARSKQDEFLTQSKGELLAEGAETGPESKEAGRQNGRAHAGFDIRWAWNKISALLFPSSLILCKGPNLSEPQFYHL